MSANSILNAVVLKLRSRSLHSNDKSAFSHSKINRELSELPLINVRQSAQHITQLLIQANNTTLGIDNRIQMHTQLQPVLQYIINHINVHLYTQKHADIRQVQTASEPILALLNEICLSHFQILQTFAQQEKLKKSNLKQLQETIAYVLHYFTMTQYVLYRNYRVLPDYFWTEANALFLLCEHLELQNERIMGLTHASVSAQDLYLQLILFELSNSYQLHTDYLDPLCKFIQDAAPQCHIGQPHNESKLFLIDIDSQQGPQKSLEMTHSCRTIQIPALQQLSAHTSVILPHLLSEHLQLAWSLKQHRQFKRSQYKKPVKLSIGLASIYHLVNPLHNRTITQQVTETAHKTFYNRRIGKYLQEPSKLHAKTPPSSQSALASRVNIIDGYIINISASGCCVTINHSQHAPPVVGELIATNETNSNFELNWQLAQICWIKHSEQQLILGIEFLAPSVSAVDLYIYPERGQSHAPVSHIGLMLTPIKKTAHYSLVTVPIFHTKQQLFLNYRQQALRIQLQALTYSTPCFQQFVFETTNNNVTLPTHQVPTTK